jgi:hypothetical protein
MLIVLQRARTAKEALKVMTDLVETYGYCGEGESISIADTEEAWLLEIAGTGKGGKGAVWVALRVPDGMIGATANMSRIHSFPMNDPENCIYSKNVIDFAVEKGYYNPNSGKPFRFSEAYNPPSEEQIRLLRPPHLEHLPAPGRFAETCPPNTATVGAKGPPTLCSSSPTPRWEPGKSSPCIGTITRAPSST